jgi:hypothetical protein
MRLILLGENNPRADEPWHAMEPMPVNSAGYRLCHYLMRIKPKEYLRLFERANLFKARVDHITAADRKEARATFAAWCSPDMHVLLLGHAVATVLGGDANWIPFEWLPLKGVERAVYVPHSSAWSPWYNDLQNLAKARAFFDELIAEARKS